MMKWHGSVGIWLTVALVFISLTGLTWSSFAGERFQTVLTALDARTPKLATGTLPTPPSEPGTPYVVAETSSSVPLHRDKIALDPSTGQVTEVLRFTDYPVLAQLTTLGILAHTGTLFGLANQIAMTAMSLGILAVIFWGYRMWWQRRPTRSRPRPLERRGVLRTTPRPMLFALALAAIVVGWLLPVFGASLVLFLIADTAAGTVMRQRAKATS